MVDLFWVIAIAAATVAFHRYVKDRDEALQGGGDPIGLLEDVARGAGAEFFVSAGRTVASMYAAPPFVANVRVTRAGVCLVAVPLAAPAPFTGIVSAKGGVGLEAPPLRRGLVALPLWSREWDDAFSVVVDRPEAAMVALTPNVVAPLLAWRANGFSPQIVLNRGSMTVRANGRWRVAGDLRAFLELARALVDAFALSTEPIQFQPGRPSAATECPVCGTSFDGADVVACAHCETPHHRDCWVYSGGCAMFGCAGGAPIVAEVPKQ